MKMINKTADAIRAELKAKGIKFGNRTGDAKIMELAAENGIETQEASSSRSIVPTNYKADYAKNGGSCGDELATALAELSKGDDGKLDPERLADIASQNGIDLARWAHLNIGQQRMNLSNVLRGKIKKGVAVKVGKHSIGAAA